MVTNLQYGNARVKGKKLWEFGIMENENLEGDQLTQFYLEKTDMFVCCWHSNYVELGNELKILFCIFHMTVDCFCLQSLQLLVYARVRYFLLLVRPLTVSRGFGNIVAEEREHLTTNSQTEAGVFCLTSLIIFLSHIRICDCLSVSFFSIFRD